MASSLEISKRKRLFDAIMIASASMILGTLKKGGYKGALTSQKGETTMARATDKRNIMDVLADWQRVEADTVEFAKREIPNAKGSLARTMLKVIELEAQKHGLLQQMIIDSMKKETVNLSPDELGILSGYINRYLEAEGERLCEAEGAAVQSRPFITSFLISYLMEDLKTQSCILKQFEDELKNASIPTSVTSKRFGASKTA